MPWSLDDLPRPARKDLEDIPARDRRAVIRKIDEIARDPGAAGLRKLAGRGNLWRACAGDWRIILELDNAAGTIRVLRVLRRSEGTYRD